MKVPLFRSLIALGAVAVLAAGSSDASTIADPIASGIPPQGLYRIDRAKPPVANKLSGMVTGSLGLSLESSPTWPLWVDYYMNCTHSWIPGHHKCSVRAGGGAGYSYDFTWSADWSAETYEFEYEQSDPYEDYSEADIVCYARDVWVTVTVTVTDGSSGTASASGTVYCGW